LYRASQKPEQGGRPMAQSSHASVPHQAHDRLRSSKRFLSTDAPNSIEELRRVSNNSIRRLQNIIAAQEDGVKKLRHQSGGTPSHALLLRTSMKDSLLTFKHTLEQIKHSAQLLEISWAMLE